MYNYDFLPVLGKCNKPILLRRGIRSFDNTTRNVLDLQSVVVVKSLCGLPVIVDPSHSGEMRELVKPMSLASIACGIDGLII